MPLRVERYEKRKKRERDGNGQLWIRNYLTLMFLKYYYNGDDAMKSSEN